MTERYDTPEQVSAALSWAEDQADEDLARDAAVFVGLWPEDDKENTPRAFIDIGLRWLHAYRELQAARAAPEQEKSMSKCEHGLTSRECYVCASPKHGEQAPAQPSKEWLDEAMKLADEYALLRREPEEIVTIIRAALREHLEKR